jgi:hypothetical protein
VRLGRHPPEHPVFDIHRARGLLPPLGLATTSPVAR